MEFRRFAIDTSLLGGLTLLAGCGPAIVGEWSLESWEVDGTDVDLTYSYQGYQVTVTVGLTIEDDLTGELELDIDVEGYGNVYSVDGDVTAEKIEARTWDVEIDVEGDVLSLECTVDGDAMACAGESEDGTEQEMGWVRAEEG